MESQITSWYSFAIEQFQTYGVQLQEMGLAIGEPIVFYMKAAAFLGLVASFVAGMIWALIESMG